MIGILNNWKDTVMKWNTFIQGNNISSEGDVLIYKSSSHFMGGMLMEYHIYKTKDHKYYGVLPSKWIVWDICLNTNDALSNIQNKTINA